MRPCRIISSVVGDYRVGWKMVAQPLHDCPHLYIAGNGRCFDIVAIISIRAFCPFCPAWIVDRLKRCGRACKGWHGGIDRKIGMINASELFSAGMNMNEFLLWDGYVNQFIALGGHFAKTSANYDQ